jgi:hypothetical protein
MPLIYGTWLWPLSRGSGPYRYDNVGSKLAACIMLGSRVVCGPSASERQYAGADVNRLVSATWHRLGVIDELSEATVGQVCFSAY